MSEYQFVEKPLLQQLASMDWQIIEHNNCLPHDPSVSLRTSFREVLLKSEFIAAVKALNPLISPASNTTNASWLTDAQCEQHGNNGTERSGVIWHTQGSGKSLTMVFLVRRLRREPALKSYKILMINDRTDLDKQLGETAALTGETVYRITSVAAVEESAIQVLTLKILELLAEDIRSLNFWERPVQVSELEGKIRRVIILSKDTELRSKTDLIVIEVLALARRRERDILNQGNGTPDSNEH